MVAPLFQVCAKSKIGALVVLVTPETTIGETLTDLEEEIIHSLTEALLKVHAQLEHRPKTFSASKLYKAFKRYTVEISRYNHVVTYLAYWPMVLKIVSVVSARVLENLE